MNETFLLLALHELESKLMLYGKLLNICKALQMGSFRAKLVVRRFKKGSKALRVLLGTDRLILFSKTGNSSMKSIVISFLGS